jgi:hypothetical protein
MDRDRLAGTAGPRDDGMDEALRALAEPRRRTILQLVARSELSGTRSSVTDYGDLLMIGRFVDAREDSAMGIFTTREAAEEFVGDDPFLHGVIRKWTVRDWNEGIVPEQRSSERWVIRRRSSDLQAACLASGRAALSVRSRVR